MSVAAAASPLRRRGIMVAVLVAGLVLALRLVELQVVHHAELAAQAGAQALDTDEIPGPRGDIVDRHGLLLATSVPVHVLAVEPRKVTVQALLELERAAPSPAHLAKKARARWAVVRRDCDEACAGRVKDLVRRGVVAEDALWWGPGWRRHYPLGPRAAHVLGFVSLDGAVAEGVERLYGDRLRTEATRLSLAVDARRQRLEHLPGEASPAAPPSLMLTLDVRIQEVLEQELAAAVERHGARGASAVVLDPATGEILALASHPTFDPNEFWRFDKESYRDTVVEHAFEPGSVMKPFTAAALVESGRAGSVEAVYCEMGRWVHGKRTIFDVGHHGWLTLPEVLEVSSNIGIVKFSSRLTAPMLHDPLAALGFGRRTGVDLPCESPGTLADARAWRAVDKDSVAFGHAVAVTPLQLASGFAALARDGMRPTPRIARAWNAGHGWQAVEVPAPHRALSARTAETVATWMRRVVEEKKGTGRRAAIPGYSVGGKTGTAEKVVDRRYDSSKNIATFAGFAPAGNPRLVAVISIDEPRLGGRTGGVTAAPVFAAVVREALRLLRVPPDRPDDPALLAARGIDPDGSADAGAEESAPTAAPAPARRADHARTAPQPPRKARG
ncbi:MAG: penicillin-binding protein 2 [Acidobacteria bacterium]|nr:penicillin-binding protein 2 [Acidobacteriota bacterium]